MVSVSTIQTQQLVALPQTINQPEVAAARTAINNETLASKKADALSVEKPVVAVPELSSTSMNFSYNTDIHGIVTQLLSKDNKVIRQIPPEEAIALYKKIEAFLKDQNQSSNDWSQ